MDLSADTEMIYNFFISHSIQLNSGYSSHKLQQNDGTEPKPETRNWNGSGHTMFAVS